MLRDPDGKYAQAYSNTSCFSNTFYCGEFGSPVVRRRLTSERNGEKHFYTAWQCRAKIHPIKYNIKCSGRHVWESVLEREFMDLLYHLKENRVQVFQEANMFIFGVIGYFFKKITLNPASIVLALILGVLAESGFRRSLVISGGDPVALITGPISIVLIVLTILSLFSPLVMNKLSKPT